MPKKVPITWDGINPLTGQPFTWDDPDFIWDGEIEIPDPINMTDEYNYISAEITAENRALILQKFDEILALLPTLPELSDAAKKRLLGIDTTTEVDAIAAEGLEAHPEWKPVTEDIDEFAKDRKFLADTEAIETKGDMTCETIQLIRRLAASDTRHTTLAIYTQVKFLAKRGNVDAKVYYDRMAPYFPGRPKAPTPPPATP